MSLEAMRERMRAAAAVGRNKVEAKKADVPIAAVEEARALPKPPAVAIGANLLEQMSAVANTEVAELPVTQDLLERAPDLCREIEELNRKLVAKEPALPSLLQAIHKQLASAPELVHMLTPEQVRALYKAWFARTQTVVSPVAKASKAKAASKNAPKLGLDDLLG